MLKGALFAILSILMVYLLTYFLLHISSSQILNLSFSSILIFFCLAGHTLRREVRDVFKALDQSLDAGRRQVARIVGRDTSQLTAQEVRTAALETLAENLSDGVCAPLFWYALLGVPGMVAYKMVNTLDSMIAYRTPRYEQFGKVAARIDDVANYLPARLTAFLILLCASPTTLLRRFKFLLTYAHCHTSPNSGWPEAALAARLDCQFGGIHDYFGQTVYKPHIGHNPRSLTNRDLHISITTCLAAEILMLLLTLSVSLYCS